MIIHIPLRVENMSPDSPAYLDMDETLEDNLIWTVTSGMITATVLVDDGNPVELALDAARMIRKLIPGAVVAGAHDELVSISDIAFRASVAAEGARLWADGKRRASAQHPFPRVEQALSQGRMTVRLYSWRKVVAWLRAVPGIEADAGVTHLDDEQIAELGARLHHEQVDSHAQDTFLPPVSASLPVRTAAPVRAVNFTSAVRLIMPWDGEVVGYRPPATVPA